MSELPSLLVGVPVLDRPANAAKVAASLRAATPAAELVFICSRGDEDEIVMCQSIGRTEIVGQMDDPGQFARKHNAGYQIAVDEGYEWYFCGADDLAFAANWFEYALRASAKTNACVVGTSDGHNANVMRGWYATHFLVHRDYLACGTIDEEGKILHEGYDHQACDVEFCQTARYRRTYAHALDSRVEHLHPHWGLAAMDPTYDKALRATHADQALLRMRQHMWGKR